MSRVERTLAETVQCIFRSPDLRIISCQLEVCHPLLPLPQPITHVCKDRSNFPVEFARNSSSDESMELFLHSILLKRNLSIVFFIIKVSVFNTLLIWFSLQIVDQSNLQLMLSYFSHSLLIVNVLVLYYYLYLVNIIIINEYLYQHLL